MYYTLCSLQNCSAKATTGCMGAFGFLASFILASSGDLAPLLLLQDEQAVTTLSQLC